MKTLTTLALFAAVGLCLPAHAHAKHDRVHAQLMGYDHAPDRAALEEAAGAAGAETALMELHGDPAVAKVIRLRALDALGLFESLAVRGYLHRLTTDAKADPVQRMRAGTALIHAHGDGALASVRPVLQDPAADPDLRVALADALVRYAGPAGRDLVRRAAVADKDPARMDALDRVLQPQENPVPLIR